MSASWTAATVVQSLLLEAAVPAGAAPVFDLMRPDLVIAALAAVPDWLPSAGPLLAVGSVSVTHLGLPVLLVSREAAWAAAVVAQSLSLEAAVPAGAAAVPAHCFEEPEAAVVLVVVASCSQLVVASCAPHLVVEVSVSTPILLFPNELRTWHLAEQF